jgi:hypothetical protein
MTNVVDLNTKRFERDEREYLEIVGRSRLAVQLLAERLDPADFEHFTDLIRGAGGHFFDAVFGEGMWGGEFWSGHSCVADVWEDDFSSGDPDDDGPHRCLACDALLPEDRIDSVCESCFQEACESAEEARREMGL